MVNFYVGINYSDGIVMASDLLAVALSGKREEMQKLHYKEKIVIGWAGAGFFEELEIGIQNLLANFSVEDIVAKEFSRFSSHGLAEARRRYAPIAPFDVQPPQLHSIIAYLGNLTFRLLYDDGSGSPLKQRSDVEVLYPISEDISDFISAAEHSSRQQALDLAISFIRNKNRKYPDEFSGLEVIDLTASGTSQILHESVS